MTLSTGSGPLPKHQYVWLEPNACGEHGWIRGVWFGLNVWPGRAFGCHVMLECGAIYRSVGLHQLALSPKAVPWEPSDAATWDAYGWQFSTLEYPFISGMQATVRLQNQLEAVGDYLFTLVPIGDGFSAEPTQAKEFYFFSLPNLGRFTAQPTNHLLMHDKSFADPEWPKFLKRQTDWFSAET